MQQFNHADCQGEAQGIQWTQETQGSPLLKMLLDAQKASQHNYVEKNAIARIAAQLNIPESSVYETACFYAHISLEPRGENAVESGQDALDPSAGNLYMVDGKDMAEGKYIVGSSIIDFVSAYIKYNQPLTLEKYVELGGFKGLDNALKLSQSEVVQNVKDSGLTGRGGAYFPTGIKLQLVKDAPDTTKYVICNADEGEPGTFKDRLLLSLCPYQILEGMIIAAYAVGAQKGILYLRGEYSDLIPRIESAIREMVEAGYLGSDIGNKNGFSFSIEIFSGAGAYICGEETALLESMEGKRGEPRLKPPFPGQEGLYRHPTLINNAETLANLPLLFEKSVSVFTTHGSLYSKGTKLICVSGHIQNPGLYEIPFGMTLQEVIAELSLENSDFQPLQFIHLGGLSGKCVTPEAAKTLLLDPIWLKENGLSLGTGAIYFAGKSVNVLPYALHCMEFFQGESCGRCTPCREGTRHLLLLLKKCARGTASQQDQANIYTIIQAMKDTSACPLGQSATAALESLMALFPEQFPFKNKE